MGRRGGYSCSSTFTFTVERPYDKETGEFYLEENAPDYPEDKLEWAEISLEVSGYDAVVAKPGDTIQIVTPQFTRTSNMTKVRSAPRPFETVKQLDYSTLRSLGCEPWDDPDTDGNVLLLFPGEWYSMIPDGFEAVSISGKEEFVSGDTDDDIRLGCLSYGILVKKKQIIN